jgi:hypothetical protein
MLGEEAGGWNGKHERSEGLHKRSAEDWGNPLRRARAAPSARFGFLICAPQRTGFIRVALRQEQAAEEGGGRRASGWRQARSVAPPYNTMVLHLPKYSRSREDRSGTGTHRPGVSKPHNT